VREGAPLPDISTPEAFKADGPGGEVDRLTDPSRGATAGSTRRRPPALGIADAVKDKTVLWPGGFAAEAIVKGQADLCVHQISEILPVKG